MKLRIAGIFAAALLAFSTMQANAVPVEVQWNGDCIDCLFDTFEPSPASATITFDEPGVVGFSYSSNLFEFTAFTEGLFGGFFDTPPLPGPADFFVSGTGAFTRFFSEEIAGPPIVEDFIFSTLAVPTDVAFGQTVFEDLNWALCVNTGQEVDLACSVLVPTATDDIGSNSTFSLASVPEPSALAVVAIGIAGLAAMRRRRRA